MAFRLLQANLSKGEFAEELTARVDVQSYSAGLKRARNVVILKYGGVTKRPGTRLVAEVRDATKPTRVIPFQFSLQQTYAIEMGQGYMRPAALGGVVLEILLTITAITKAANATVTAAYHAYVVGDDVYFSGITGMDEINGKIARVVSVVDANNFTVNVDTTGFGTFVSDSGGIVRVGAPPAPPAPPAVPPVVTPPADPVVGGGGSNQDRRNDDGSYP